MKNLLKRMDKPLLFFTIVYSIIGLLLVFSASSVAAVVQYKVAPYNFFLKQAMFILIGYGVGFLFILKFPIKNYKKLMPILLFGLAAALVLLLVYGEFTNNAKSWFKIFGFSVQPSEFAKLILIIYLGIFFGTFANSKGNNWRFLIPLGIAGIIVLLVLMQPDFGTAAIIAGIIMLMFFAIPFPNHKNIKILKWITLGLFGLSIIVVLSGSKLLSEEQLSRLNYKNPCNRYTEKTGYQVCNGFIAINNGGWFGKGLGNSTQKYLYLPEAHTDFIFPIAVEELGVLISVGILLGYLFILFRILYIAKKCTNLRNSIICYGVCAYLLLHLIINFCGITALIPLTGVPVPFFSYGGSITINSILAMFIVQRIAVESSKERELEEIRSV